MTQQEILLVLSIPIFWFVGLLGYKILHLFYLWIKYKLVQMLIEKHKDKKIDNMNFIEELSDDILKVLAVAGMKYYSELRREFE